MILFFIARAPGGSGAAIAVDGESDSSLMIIDNQFSDNLVYSTDG